MSSRKPTDTEANHLQMLHRRARILFDEAQAAGWTFEKIGSSRLRVGKYS